MSADIDRINALANEAMDSISTEDDEEYAHARAAIEIAIERAIDAERAAHERTKADAVAMRAVHCHCGSTSVTHAFAQHEDCEYRNHHCDNCHHLRLCTVDACRFVAWQDGRDLAERVRLLEAVATAARAFRQSVHLGSHDTRPEQLDDALATLDEKGVR